MRTQLVFGLRSMWGNPTLVRSCFADSNFYPLRFADSSSTGMPLYGLIRASANSARCKMTGNEHNVGFLAAGSGVQQFQLSLGRCCVLECRRSSAQLTSTKHTTSLLVLAAVLEGTGNFDSQDAVRGTPTSGVTQGAPLKACQCLWRGVSRTRLFRVGPRHDAMQKESYEN